MCDILTQVCWCDLKFLPHPPTQAMDIFSSFASIMLWTLFIFVVAVIASSLQVHTLTLVVLDSVEPIALSLGACLLFCIATWYVAPLIFHSRTAGPRTCSQGTQTSEELPCLSTIYASRGGKCYHVSARCPNNGGLQDITPLRRCRNCG